VGSQPGTHRVVTVDVGLSRAISPARNPKCALHFADKREVLFGGQGFPAAVFTLDRHDLALQRRAIIAAHSELQERELLKRAEPARSAGPRGNPQSS